MPLETKSVSNLRIIDEEDGTVVAERGMISCNGDTVKVYNWNPEKGKYDQVDRIKGAELKENKRFSRVTGVSELYRGRIGVKVEDATRSLKLEHDAAAPVEEED